MGIALVIVGGLIAMTIVAVIGDVAAKRAKNAGLEAPKQLKDLENRVRSLELAVGEKSELIDELRQELSFVNRLLEDKTKP